MSHAALTAKYRPQTFATVAGQETLKAILSRAALEDKVAPAYLFSGTRGVGKTTLARVFAKALNCRQAPTAEPCNQCEMCRSITAGSAMDVVEIDGASNRGIDDVRRLKEVVGYAPMDGRYKIFIIDEAHMLSREAFNALLKTLEEPPARVTFIMATTEPHKFPATIISRCQHYVFKRVPEATLVAHLGSILQQENIRCEESALRLLARRGAGSVRDSMSLLGQVLALGPGELTEAAVRQVLGLAGQEAFTTLLAALATGDAVSISRLLREMLDGGLDIGFFLRELVTLWRNLFLLNQSGRAAIPVVELPQEEANTLLQQAEKLSLRHIHACWQMTLEGQRRVLTSVEPALALELLLLNLALLPQLLSLESLSAIGRRTTPREAPARPLAPAQGQHHGLGISHTKDQATGLAEKKTPEFGELAPEAAPAQEAEATPAGIMPPAATSFATSTPEHVAMPEPAPMLEPEAMPDYVQEQEAYFAAMPPEADVPHDAVMADVAPMDYAVAPHASPVLPTGAEFGAEPPQPANQPEQAQPGQQAAPSPTGYEPALEDIVARALQNEEAPAWIGALLRRITGVWEGGTLVLQPEDTFTGQRVADTIAQNLLREAIQALRVEPFTITVAEPVVVRKDRDSLRKEIFAHPLVQIAEEKFQARIIDFGQLR
ncbi:DNA polymerase III subunit gamma/tau [Desulfovibrio cuneatus]|uniref:DNA polymerase III subunit gamma/tau n=1 Tax=Desulfovibrio cuneatus TaxID=159728 RepID=UPI000425132D|nr:DNA polymerase III subunit gamma/tau [Desulfovibrio cuneatus]